MLSLENRGAKSAGKVRSHVKALPEAAGDRRAADLTTPQVERLTREWLDARAAPATVNRRLELLRQAYREAARRTPPRVSRVPYVPLLRVRNARQNFLSRADFEALAANIEDADVRDFVLWSWWTGMRPNESRSLTWAMFDREGWTLRLDPKAAKIGKGRVLALEGPLREIIERRVKARRIECRLIFHRVSKGQPGQPILDYRRAWVAACKAAGLRAGRNVEGGVVPYDLRRCAVRNMVRGGTDFTVAMKISGHRTRSTFDRYNIVSEDDIREAAVRTAAYVSTLPTERKVAAMGRRRRELGQNTDNAGSGVPHQIDRAGACGGSGWESNQPILHCASSRRHPSSISGSRGGAPLRRRGTPRCGRWSGGFDGVGGSGWESNPEKADTPDDVKPPDTEESGS